MQSSVPAPSAGLKTSRLLDEAGFVHGFFTRHGGVSTGAYATLNFSSAAGDSRENVAQNIARAAQSLGVAPERVYFLSQVHGTQTHILTGDEAQEQVLFEAGDALLSQNPTLACGVRTADCVPILIAERRSGMVGAIHAGWRGVQANIVRVAIELLRERVGGRGELLAAIGPHISANVFEVSPEVAEAICESSPVKAGVISYPSGAKPHVDLRRVVRAQLTELGLAPEHIDDVFGCTLSDPADWFSYRRDGAESGRHLSAIVARAPG